MPRFDWVIFVDAALAEVSPRMTRTEVQPAWAAHAVSHYLTPRTCWGWRKCFTVARRAASCSKSRLTT
ncbi:MAG: hypothetical protein MUF81_11445 [Verrucomicrobia bacterium]|nr:hypothetical protein [Verrucomicrobiota bacterium]